MKEATERAYETAVAEAIARGETPDEKPPDGGRVDGGVDGGRADASDTVLPVARVKRIIKLDKEVKQASADAIKCVSKAVELFLEGLAVGSHAAMRAAKPAEALDFVLASVHSQPAMLPLSASAKQPRHAGAGEAQLHTLSMGHSLGPDPRAHNVRCRPPPQG